MSSRTPIAVVDSNYLCHLALHTTGGLTNGVIYGFMLQLESMLKQFEDHYFVFCFDGRKNYRKDMLESYKQNRAYPQPKDFHSQKHQIRTSILPQLGFESHLHEGFEADDLIASVIRTNPKHRVTIISSDSDMFQLLSPKVRVWLLGKKKMVTVQSFTEEYQIGPTEWTKVKTIAGCRSDNIPGVERCGEVTAIKYLRGVLTGKMADKIQEELEKNKKKFRLNRKLVTLPLEGTPPIQIKATRASTIDRKGWKKVALRFKFSSMVAGIRNVKKG